MTNQLHGKNFEDILKACMFPGASDSGRKVTATFDVEAKFDKHLGIPTSIKVAKHCNVIGLADARTFWKLRPPFRMLIACWKQKDPTTKLFYKIHEFIINDNIMQKLLGEVTYHEIEALHNGISLSKYPIGTHLEARRWVKNQKLFLQQKKTKIILNPKIDSKSQRRLQCSLQLDVLENLSEIFPEFSKNQPSHIIYNEIIGNLPLPFPIKSPPRQFN